MAPPARSTRRAGGALLPPPRQAGPGPARLLVAQTTDAAGLADRISRERPAAGRGSRVLVCGEGASGAADALCDALAQGHAWRCLVLDGVRRAPARRPSLLDVVDGRANLSQAVWQDAPLRARLWAAATGDADRLVHRPHPLAVILDALSFAYDAVLMSTLPSGEAMLGEVLAAVSDHAILAPEGLGIEDEDLAPFRRQDVRSIGVLEPTGEALWLAGPERPCH